MVGVGYRSRSLRARGGVCGVADFLPWLTGFASEVVHNLLFHTVDVFLRVSILVGIGCVYVAVVQFVEFLIKRFHGEI